MKPKRLLWLCLAGLLLLIVCFVGVFLAKRYISVDVLKEHLDVTKTDATDEELSAFIADVGLTSENVSSLNLPLLLTSFLEDSRGVVSEEERLVTFREKDLKTPFQTMDSIVALGLYEENDSMIRMVYWRVGEPRYQYAHYIHESAEQVNTTYALSDAQALLDCVEEFSSGSWERSIVGELVGHKAPYEYLLSVEYADGSIAQSHIYGETGLLIPDDMQAAIDATWTVVTP